MELSSDQLRFLEHCAEARKIAFSFHDPLIVHHYDADGLTSGALAVAAFQKINKKVRTLCVRTLDDRAIEQVRNEKEIIFTDLGSGNARVNELKDVLVIDHHQPANVQKMQANCMLFGMDGGKELSASSTAYLVFRERVDIGTVGAVGDLQTPFIGLNRYMVEEGAAKGEIKIENDLCFYGRYSRPLIPFLLYSDEVYIPGLSYREDRITEFLSELKIPLEGDTETFSPKTKGKNESWRTYSDLYPEEKRRLISALADVLASAGRVELAAQLIREGYTFPGHPRNETYEANEFSTLLNACGRNDRPDIGLRVCLQDETAYGEAAALLQLHRRNIRAGIEYAQTRVQDMGPFYLLDARGHIHESIIGIICGMWLRATARKPVFGISLAEEGRLKASGRANGYLLRNGVNIGLLLRATVAALGGVGGGHKAAGGASFPQEKLNEFLLGIAENLKKIRPVS